MKKIIHSLVIVLLSGIFLPAKAQKFVVAPKNMLHVGDQMPEHTFPEIINADQPTIKLEDFKGKLVILDFWNSGCSSCIALMPYMQQLQDKYKEQVQVILVNTNTKKIGDTKEITLKILGNLEKNKGAKINLPVSLNDDLLDSYFPTWGVPMHIWIDGAGKIIARTSGDGDVTESNIEAALQGKKGNFHMYEYIPKGETYHPFTFSEGKIEFGDEATQFHSIIYKAEIGNYLAGWKLDSLQINHGITLTNVNLLYGLYQHVYPELTQMLSKGITIKVKDPDLAKLIDPASEQKFCYDLYSAKPIDFTLGNELLKKTLESTFGKLYFMKTANGDLLITDTKPATKKVTRVNTSSKPSKSN